jgi:hypothetical protein
MLLLGSIATERYMYGGARASLYHDRHLPRRLTRRAVLLLARGAALCRPLAEPRAGRSLGGFGARDASRHHTYIYIRRKYCETDASSNDGRAAAAVRSCKRVGHKLERYAVLRVPTSLVCIHAPLLLPVDLIRLSGSLGLFGYNKNTSFSTPAINGVRSEPVSSANV